MMPIDTRQTHRMISGVYLSRAKGCSVTGKDSRLNYLRN